MNSVFGAPIGGTKICPKTGVQKKSTCGFWAAPGVANSCAKHVNVANVANRNYNVICS